MMKRIIFVFIRQQIYAADVADDCAFEVACEIFHERGCRDENGEQIQDWTEAAPFMGWVPTNGISIDQFARELDSAIVHREEIRRAMLGLHIPLLKKQDKIKNLTIGKL